MHLSDSESPPKLPLWLTWTIASAFAAGLAGLIQAILFANPQIGGLVWVGPLLGAPIVGLIQGAVLRSHLRRARAWAKASAIGLLAGLAVGGLLFLLSSQLSLGGSLVLLGFPIAAAIQGAFQARVLRSRVSQPNRWIFICALAWLINLVPMLIWGMILLNLADQSLAAYGFITGFLNGGLVGLIRGIGLGLLLYPPSSRSRG